MILWFDSNDWPGNCRVIKSMERPDGETVGAPLKKMAETHFSRLLDSFSPRKVRSEMLQTPSVNLCRYDVDLSMVIEIVCPVILGLRFKNGQTIPVIVFPSGRMRLGDRFLDSHIFTILH